MFYEEPAHEIHVRHRVLAQTVDQPQAGPPRVKVFLKIPIQSASVKFILFYELNKITYR